MKAPVNVFALSCLVTTVQLALLAAPATAQDEAATSDGDSAPAAAQPAERSKQLGADRWVPSLAVVSGVTYQKWDADVSSICSGCTNPPNQPLVRVPASGDDNDVTPFVGGQLELMTPELPLPLSPRFFAGGSVVAAFGAERHVANEGNVGAISSPLPTADDETPLPENSMIGQGSRTSAELVDDFIYEAHAGISFPFEIFGRQLRVKPSAGWIRYEVDAKGAVSDAECRQASPISLTLTNCNPLTDPPPPPGNFPGDLRSIQLRADDTGTFDGVGGGMDIEMDVFHIGPFSSSLFLGAHAYKILGEREIEFGATASFPDTGIPGLGAADYASNHRVEVDPFFYRMGLGFRMNWVGSAGTD